jgi:AcrR family transcriptional regulator
MRRLRMTRVEQNELTRQRLLEAAEIVIARLGYAGASIDLIASEAGFSRGAVYSNFANKEELFLEVPKTNVIKERVEIETFVKSEFGQGWQHIRTWLRQSYLSGDRPLVRAELQLHAHRSPAFAKQYLAFQRVQTRELAHLVRHAMVIPESATEVQCESIAEALFALAQGLRMRTSTQDCRSGTPDPSTIETFCEHLISELTGR